MAAPLTFRAGAQNIKMTDTKRVFMHRYLRRICSAIGCILLAGAGYAQGPSMATHPDLEWFKNAKFGIFIHWGLYAELGGQWKGKDYFGSGEWIMHRAKIPYREYAAEASRFNPVDFNADQWADIIARAGAKYMVITAKHHEGFAMFDSKVTDFDIVDATPYKKDPMKALAVAVRKRGLRFGFYYSQFLDWHEPNGGGNTWDFPKHKDYALYYRTKAIPQLKELLRHYGPLGIVWFDMPGGLTTGETSQMIDSLRRLQPECLFSSRVGHDLGDYRDFGDSEVPPVPIHDAWEALFTANDSWGYIAKDKNFKSAPEIIRLLATIASRGGNLLLNIGPDALGNFPPYEVKSLLETGDWLRRYGQSIYGTTYGLVPAQPWGVTTSKPGRLFAHIFTAPKDGRVLVPFRDARVTGVRLLGSGEALSWKKSGDMLEIRLPGGLPDNPDAVAEIDYAGLLPDRSADPTQTISRQFPVLELPAVKAACSGKAAGTQVTYSHYFGDWKHDYVDTGLVDTADALRFRLQFLEAGDYRVRLDYACSHAMAGGEGLVAVAGQALHFVSLETGEYDSHKPLMFIDHSIGLISIPRPGSYTLTLRPDHSLPAELLWLRSVRLEPIP